MSQLCQKVSPRCLKSVAKLSIKTCRRIVLSVHVGELSCRGHDCHAASLVTLHNEGGGKFLFHNQQTLLDLNFDLIDNKGTDHTQTIFPR